MLRHCSQQVNESREVAVFLRIAGVISPSLTMSAVSRRFRAHCGIRSESSAISLWLRFAKTNLGLASNRCGSGTQSDPTISSIATSIMITSSNSPVKGSGKPNHYVGDLLHTMAISGFSRVRTELLHLVVVPSAPPHPVQLDRQFPRHRDFGDLAPAPHGQ